jgi:MFS family permease
MSSTSSWSKDVGIQQSLFLEPVRALIAYLLRQRKNVQSITPDGRLVILARALRTFGYGFTSVLLGVMLTRAGLPTVSIGLLLAVTALGSITFSLVMGMFADRLGRRRLPSRRCWPCGLVPVLVSRSLLSVCSFLG